MSIGFLLTSLLVVASPGTGVLYTVSMGLSRGARASMVAAAGCTLGIVPHLAIAILGAALAFQANAFAFQLLKYCGASYLLYMAWNTWRDRSTFEPDQQVAAKSSYKIVMSAIALNLLNPKLPIFFLAFLPQFIAKNDSHMFVRLLELSAIFMLMTLLVFALYGVFASSMRAYVLGRSQVTTWLRRAFALGFVGLSLKLIL
ncbi:LysE family translocator [Pinirhizobacter soli]|uniref:LysE family translocator n=1 Tax=Pinirhizobacter soli TaxID=2786953 RepID=UPI00202A76D7|nr:LysE family translocator [Pinirhizobacter soli]